MDWIHVDDEIFDYAGQPTSSSDLALYGRVTFDMMEAFWPTTASQPSATKHDKEHAAWYNQVNMIVISRTLKGKSIKNTTIVSETVGDAICNVKQNGTGGVIIFGSPSASHTLMRENLIDEFWVFVNPILLGRGIPLFKNIQNNVKLELMKSHTFTSGVVCLHYRKV